MKTITTFNYIGNKIIVNGHENVLAPVNIIGCLVLDEYIILLLDADESKSDANIYCYNISGIVQWTVPKPADLHGRNYYTSIYVLSDLYLYAYNINGIEVKLDYTNGHVLDSELIK